MLRLLLAFVASLLLLTHANAQVQNEKLNLARKVVLAQGLDRQLEEQVLQTRAGAPERMRQNLAAFPIDAENPKARDILLRYEQEIANMFAVEELISVWAKHLSESTTVRDLRAMLAYYSSATGKKDVNAALVSHKGFTNWLLEKTQERQLRLTRKMFEELLEAGVIKESGAKK